MTPVGEFRGDDDVRPGEEQHHCWCRCGERRAPACGVRVWRVGPAGTCDLCALHALPAVRYRVLCAGIK